MNTASLALLLLAGSVGAATDAPVPLNDRAIKIPFRLAVAPAEVNEVVLFVSIDQGKNWSRDSSIRPTETFLPFQAPTDGQYWFNIAVMYRNGSQVPIDVSLSPPQQKVVIDTQKPAVNITSAERVADEVAVNWEIQEANPDLASLKLEYRSADASTGSFWTSVPASPGLAGQARFRPSITGPITLRLSINDAVNNAGFAEKTITAPAIVPPAAMKIEEPVQAPVPVQSVPAPVAQPAAPVALAPAPVSPASAAQQIPAVETTPTVITVATSNRSLPNNGAFPPLRPEMSELYYTNEPQVTVDYEVDHGPSGISKIEVYLTQDDGRTWLKWQELTPNDLHKGEPMKSNSVPVTVRLPDREGTFGYCLIPYSGAQMSQGARRAAPSLSSAFSMIARRRTSSCSVRKLKSIKRTRSCCNGRPQTKTSAIARSAYIGPSKPMARGQPSTPPRHR